MKRCLGLLTALLLILLIPAAHAQGSPPAGAAAGAAAGPAAGAVAFVGTDAAGTAALYVLDLASGKTGQVIIPVEPDTDLDWHPDGDSLVFTTLDGGYGMLRSLRGCFDPAATCADSVEVFPSFIAQQVEWSPDGETLFIQTDEGLKSSPPLARPAGITDLDLDCPHGIAIANSTESLLLLCAAEDTAGNVVASVYEGEDTDFSRLYDLGTFPGITAYDIGPDGRSAAGTRESAGDSGFYAPVPGAPTRLAAYQIYIYDLDFTPDGSQIAIIGATSDATGDGTLSDGDPAELYLFDTSDNQLEQIPGFTGATDAAWSPDGALLLSVIEQETFRIYDPASRQVTPVNASLPQTGLQITRPAWSPAEQVQLPTIAIATQPPQATAVASPTRAATLTPPPTLTPFPTVTPWPTFTAIPSATPGSPLGVGCQYAYGTTNPFAIGDLAEVTQYGAAVRFRGAGIAECAADPRTYARHPDDDPQRALLRRWLPLVADTAGIRCARWLSGRQRSVRLLAPEGHGRHANHAAGDYLLLCR